MAEVSIHKVKPGSVLAKDVTVHGTPLVTSGTVINERQIALLKNRGVNTVFIQQSAADERARLVSDVDYAERCRKLDRMFESVENEPHMAVIKQAARERLNLRRPWE